MSIVNIIGAGPAGLQTAINLAKKRVSCSVIDKSLEIGTPVQCSGLVSKAGSEESGIDYNGCIVNKIRGAKIFSPDMQKIEVFMYKPVAYVIDKEMWLKKLQLKAEMMGVEFFLGEEFIDKSEHTVFTKDKTGKGKMQKGNIVIGADGPESLVRKKMGIETDNSNLVHAYQITAETECEKDFVHVYYGDYAKGFFAWLIPQEDGLAKIGLGAKLGTDIRGNFQKFLKKSGIQVRGKPENELSGLIPIGRPLDKIADHGSLLIGDAAYQTKATTGGGIVIGSIASQIAADVIVKNLSLDYSLDNYSRICSEKINKDLMMHYKIRKFVDQMSEERINKIFKKLTDSKINDVLEIHGNMDFPTRFAGKILFNPGMWRLSGEITSFLRFKP